MTNQLIAVVDKTVAPLVVAIEEAKRGDLVPVAGLSAPRQKNDVTPIRPHWMKDEDDTAAKKMVREIVQNVKDDPADVRLLMKAQAIGRDGERALARPVALYERKVSAALKANQEGSTTDQTLLDVKRNIDLVNPAVIRSMPVAKRFTFGLLKQLPKGEEVLKMIYENRETVQSVINGLVEQLRIDAEAKEADLEDIATIYRELIQGQRLIERDIYVGQLTIVELKDYLDAMKPGPERENVSQFVADLTTAVIFRMDEENVNLQFFAGAQNYAKLATAAIHLLRNMAPLLQRSVMAALGLSVATTELAHTMRMTQQIADAIGTTLADTAKNQEAMTGQMTEMRSRGGINLEKLEEACASLERVFEMQAQANQLIIERGGQTMDKLAGMSDRLRRRVGSGHESMLSIAAPAA